MVLEVIIARLDIIAKSKQVFTGFKTEQCKKTYFSNLNTTAKVYSVYFCNSNTSC